MRVTEFAHEFLRPALHLGTHHLDATCGNGHDTAFLLRYSTPRHQVIAMDLQRMAIVATRERITATGEGSRLRTVCDDHTNLERHLFPDSRLGAAIFNLGYLPGGDHSIVTSPESTLAALHAAKTYLVPGGRLAVVVYPDHPGGQEEAEAVDSWFEAAGGQKEARPKRGPYLCRLTRKSHDPVGCSLLFDEICGRILSGTVKGDLSPDSSQSTRNEVSFRVTSAV